MSYSNDTDGVKKSFGTIIRVKNCDFFVDDSKVNPKDVLLHIKN